MAGRKKVSVGIARKRIRAFRGTLKRAPGRKPFALEWAEHKLEEKRLEEKKFRRLAALGKKNH
jgi:hypothetical protein